jgi:hypothetical protein
LSISSLLVVVEAAVKAEAVAEQAVSVLELGYL